MMRLHLEGEGSRVRRVASAEAALAFTGGFTPDLITLDLLLPGIDAWDFLKLWRRQATRTKKRRLPAVVLGFHCAQWVLGSGWQSHAGPSKRLGQIR